MHGERALAVTGECAKRANVQVAHRGTSCPSGTASSAATATGSASSRSSCPPRRNPIVSRAWGIAVRSPPHSGHTTRYAAAERVKRSRQLRQQTWVITDPFHRSPNTHSSLRKLAGLHHPVGPSSNLGPGIDALAADAQAVTPRRQHAITRSLTERRGRSVYVAGTAILRPATWTDRTVLYRHRPVRRSEVADGVMRCLQGAASRAALPGQ